MRFRDRSCVGGTVSGLDNVSLFAVSTRGAVRAALEDHDQDKKLGGLECIERDGLWPWRRAHPASNKRHMNLSRPASKGFCPRHYGCVSSGVVGEM